MTSRLSRAVILGFLLFAAACRGGATASTRLPGTLRAPKLAPDSLAGPWMIRGRERMRAQRVDITAVLESRIDSTRRADTLSTRAWYEWTENPMAASGRVAGLVRAFAVRRGTDSLWRVLDAPALPVSFVAEVPWAGGAPELQLPSPEGCTPEAAVVSGWRETWVFPPRELSVGTAWRDSSDSPLCRDGIVLRSTAVREFVVEGSLVRDGTLRVVVLRRSHAVIRGSGVQFGDTVRFVGAASGLARLELLLEGAVIAAGAGTSELRLTMQGSRRTQELVQRSSLVLAIP
jgi:hypothetical protein